MLSKREYGFIITILLIFIFLIMILLFVSFSQHIKFTSDDVTYREIEFIRYRYK